MSALLNRPEKQQFTIFLREDLPQSSWSIKWHEIHLFLSLFACMYVLGRNILSQSCCSLCSYVCIGLPGPAHPLKVKYSLRSDQLYCLFPCSYEQRENISLFWNVQHTNETLWRWKKFLLSLPSQTCMTCLWGEVLWGRYLGFYLCQTL